MPQQVKACAVRPEEFRPWNSHGGRKAQGSCPPNNHSEEA